MHLFFAPAYISFFLIFCVFINDTCDFGQDYLSRKFRALTKIRPLRALRSSLRMRFTEQTLSIIQD